MAETTVRTAGLFDLWPAALGLLVASGIALASFVGIRGSRRINAVDDIAVWRTLARHTAETVFLLTRDGRILYANRWGADANDIIGKSIDSLIAEPDQQRWREFFVIHQLNQGATATETLRVVLPNGATSFWEFRVTLLSPPAAEAEYMLCGRDVSDVHRRQAAKDALYRITMSATQTDSLSDLVHFTEQQLSAVLDTRNFFLALYDKNSDTYTRVFSRDHADAIKASTKPEVLRGGLTDYVRDLGKPLLMNDENREELKVESGVIALGDAAMCWLGVPLIIGSEVQGVFVVQSYDNPNCYSAADAEFLTLVAASIGRVIERKQAHDRLARREARLRLLTDRLPALIWSEDAEGFITYVCGTALTDLDLVPEDLIGRRISDVMECSKEPSEDKGEFRFRRNNRTYDAYVDQMAGDDGIVTGSAAIALDVTAKDLANEELKLYNSLTADAFVVTDRNGDVVRCNDGLLQMTGYTRDEWAALKGITVVHPDDISEAQKLTESLLSGNRASGVEFRTRCKSGEYKWIEWNAVYSPGDGLIYCSGKDITQRRQMENDLREKKEQLRLFVQHSPAALAMFDRDMCYLVVSERWREDYNLGDAEIIGRSHYEVFPEIDERWKEVHRRCLDGATENCPRDRFVRMDSKVDWVRWEIRPWFTGNGEIGGIILFTEVITDEVNAELEAQKSRDLARQIIASSLDAVVAIDSNGLVSEWNPQAETIFGFAREEALNHPLLSLVIPDACAEGFRLELSDLLPQGNSQVLNRLVEATLKRKDGSLFQAEFSVTPIKFGDDVHLSAFIRDVSERNSRQRELDRSRHQLREAQRIAGLGFWEWNAAKGELRLSDEKLALYGRPNMPMPTSFETFLDMVHPDDREHTIRSFQSIVATGSNSGVQYRIIRPDGSICHVYSQGEAEWADDGTLIRLFGTTLNVTERVQAEDRVRSSEERLALAIEGSSDGFWDWNVVSGDCYFSPRIVEWLGFDPNEFRHHVSFWEDLIHPDYLKTFNESYAEHVEKRTSHYEIEERVRTKSGAWIWVLSRGKVVQWNEDGTPLRAAGTWTNITTRKEMETRALQLGNILDNAMNEVYVIEPESLRIIEVNRRACLNTGYSVAELQQMCIPDLLQNRTGDDLRALARPLLAGEQEVVRGEGIHVRKDGTTYPFEVSVQIMEWHDQVVFVSVGNDVTDKRNAEIEFENLQAQLRHAQRLETIGTLAGGIAHDFNNILTPILGYADMVAAEMEPESPARKDIEQVIHAANRAKGLVQQILAFSRQSEQARRPLQIDRVVSETIRLLRASVPPHIEIIQSVENVGNVNSDPTLLNQILMNLCTNAYQAIGEDNGEIEISLTAEYIQVPNDFEHAQLSAGNYAKLTVRDSGVGMDSVTIGRIFEPFFTTKAVGQGTGLGLSVVHGIVQAHGGAIVVDSRVGTGTRVTVYLPLLEESVSRPAEQTREAPRGSEHLLICDDDEAILLLAKQMLEAYGYSVTATGDPVTALALLPQAKPPFAAVIVDDRMPILSGRNVALAVHDYKPDLPVILLSASSNADADLSHFSAVLNKPVAACDLALAVRNSINNTYLPEVQ